MTLDKPDPAKPNYPYDDAYNIGKHFTDELLDGGISDAEFNAAQKAAYKAHELAKAIREYNDIKKIGEVKA